MPQAWYRDQARFNDPESKWQKMWLRDSVGEYVDIALAGKYPGAHGINEGADYTQYKHRMLYDWREPSAVDYFVNEVLRFILDSPELDGGESSPDRAFSILVSFG